MLRLGCFCIPLAIAGDLKFSTGGLLSGCVAVIVAALGVWREKVYAAKLKEAQEIQLAALRVVDAEKLKSELWSALQNELNSLRKRDMDQQLIIEKQTALIKSLQLQITAAREDRQKLSSELHELQKVK